MRISHRYWLFLYLATLFCGGLCSPARAQDRFGSPDEQIELPWQLPAPQIDRFEPGEQTELPDFPDPGLPLGDTALPEPPGPSIGPSNPDPDHRTELVLLDGFDIVEPVSTEGDAELDWGPFIHVRLIFFRVGNQIYRQAYMAAVESTVSTWPWHSHSEAENWTFPELIYEAPEGWVIQEPLVQEDDVVITFQDSDHAADYFETPYAYIVVMGDGPGDDIGVHTAAYITWEGVLPVKLKRVFNLVDGN